MQITIISGHYSIILKQVIQKANENWIKSFPKGKMWKRNEDDMNNGSKDLIFEDDINF
jgi:hypothetical protein